MEHSAPCEIALSILFPPGSEIYAEDEAKRLEEPKVVYKLKETVSSSHKQDWCAHKFTETMLRLGQVQIKQNPNTERESGPNDHPELRTICNL